MIAAQFTFHPAAVAEAEDGGRRTMIDAIIDLIHDGNDQPQNFRLRIRYANQGENPPIVSVFGTEAHLRVVLIDGGRPEVEINTLFENVGGKKKTRPRR
jgi:hypothetical protein